MRKYIFNILLFLLGTVLVSCATTQNTGQTANGNRGGGDTILVQQPQTLGDYLTRVAGVRFTGNNISIRGGGPPLFIIDGVWVGRSYYSAASAVNVNDIASVEVLKNPSELAIYGRQGGNGVIIIHTKGANPDAGKYQ